jgi:hypothetical protein
MECHFHIDDITDSGCGMKQFIEIFGFVCCQRVRARELKKKQIILHKVITETRFGQGSVA